MQAPTTYTFIGGARGRWTVTQMAAVSGDALASVPALDVQTGEAQHDADAWALRGVIDDAQYITADERGRLAAVQPPLDRPEATCAALIPIKKSPAWWALDPAERRAIMEERSHHVEIGMRYLPAVARRLHYCRDADAPFDFLTWFEYAPAHAEAFEQLTAALRASEEWRYVVREVDVRLRR
jgi:chlorite dismutase